MTGALQFSVAPSLHRQPHPGSHQNKNSQKAEVKDLVQKLLRELQEVKVFTLLFQVFIELSKDSRAHIF